MCDSLQPHGLQATRFLCPWDFPGKSTGLGCHFLLQRIFLNQGSNPGLLHCRQTLNRTTNFKETSLSSSHFNTVQNIICVIMHIDESVFFCFATEGSLGRISNLNHAGESYKDISDEVCTLLMWFQVTKSAGPPNRNYIVLMLWPQAVDSLGLNSSLRFFNAL